MKVAFVGCWSRMRIYAIQMSHLRQALEEEAGDKIKTITSNCGCFYTDFRSVLQSFSNYREGLTTQDVSFIKLPHFRAKRGRFLGTALRGLYRSLSEPYRARRYFSLSKNADILHFFQSSDAFGYEALEKYLRLARGKKTVVTVHRFSPIQTEQPHVNALYNQADAVTVSTEHTRRFLIDSGVAANKLHVIPYGASIVPLTSQKREGAIMFAGSPLIDVKGFAHLARALRILRDQGLKVPLKLHGYYMPGHKEWAVAVAEKEGVTDLVQWLSFNSEQELISAYQASMMCVIPYTEYPGCFPVTVAIANGTPVVASDAMGIPEYVDGAAIVVKAASAEELAAGIAKMQADGALRERCSRDGRAIAEKKYAWSVLARQTMQVYSQVAASHS